MTLKWLTRDPIYGRLLVLLEGRRLPASQIETEPPCCKHQGTVPIRLVSRYAHPDFSYFKTERSVSFSQADAE